MGKVLLWIVIIFAVLFALRLYNANKAKRRGEAARASARRESTPADPMVRCERCGVFLPKAEATAVSTGYVCADPACIRRG